MLQIYMLLHLALGIYRYIVLASVIFSWLYVLHVVNPSNQLVRSIGQFLYKATEPLLRPIRNILPEIPAVDISPFVLLLLISLVKAYLLPALFFGL